LEFEAIVKEFCAAVEAGDGSRLAGLFTADGVYHDTFYGAYQGREAIRDMLEQRFYGDAEKFFWEMRDPVCAGQIGYTRWRFSFTSRMPDSAGKRVVAEGMSCFELEDGKIRHYSEKFDSGIALSQLDFAPERLGKLHRRWAAEQNGDAALARHVKG
jgi:ketosteroid isomerase-like protein